MLGQQCSKLKKKVIIYFLIGQKNWKLNFIPMKIEHAKLKT